MMKHCRMMIFYLTLITVLPTGCKDDLESAVVTDEEDDDTDTTTTEIVYGDNHESEDDYVWDSEGVIDITLNGSSIAAESESVTIEGTVATITTAGNYRLTGTLSDGQVIVDTEDSETVRLILAGVTMTSTTSAPIYISQAEKTILVLEAATENYIEDAEEYVYEGDDDEPDAAIFSDDNLTIYGAGRLTVVGNYNEAIKSKDGLIISGGVLEVTSVDDGIQGKDYLIIKNSEISVIAEGDGLKSDNDEDTALGYITIEEGNYTIVAGADAIQAETNLSITSGTFSLETGGGSDASFGEDDSAKGLKAGVSVTVSGGTFDLNTADDAVHSDEVIVIKGGDFTIASGDDGVHADISLEINGGDITVTKSYEGLESAEITINDGNISVVSDDDGINVAGGNDNSGWNGGGFSGTSESYYLYINGGYTVVNAKGDGLDANGSIEMTGGTVVVHGPVSSGNGALDYDVSFEISGGLLLAAGSAGMAQTPGSGSSQYVVMASFNTTQSAGQIFHLETSAGSEIITFAPAKAYQVVVFSSPELAKGSGYDAYSGGSSTGSVYEGVYSGGTYTGGTRIDSFTISSVVTTISD